MRPKPLKATLFHLSLPLALLLAQVLSGCAKREQTAGGDSDEARMLVRRFLAAESSGGMDSALAVMFPHDDLGNPFCELGTDYLAVTAEARELGTVLVRDTVVVNVEYRVLGDAFSLDPGEVGNQNWRFRSLLRADTVSFEVTHNSTGRLLIVCNGPKPNHRPAMAIAGYFGRMDAPSRDQWTKAVTASRSLGWPSPDR